MVPPDGFPPVLIVGTGAMACLFGARLAPHASVTMLGTWTEGLEALKRDGIRIEDDGSPQPIRVGVTGNPADCVPAPLALVLVKSWQTARAAAMLRRCLAPDGIGLTLQNGIGNLEILQQALGRERAALGVTTFGATLLGPGCIRPAGDGITHIGAHERLGTLPDLLDLAGFRSDVVEDVHGLAWGKLVINASINPLAALLRVPNGALLEPGRQGAWQVAQEAALEAAAVAAAEGVSLPFDDAVAQVAQVLKDTASNRSSMLQDVERGRPTEIEAINGQVVAGGDRHHLPVPVNRTLVRLVQSITPPCRGDGQ